MPTVYLGNTAPISSIVEGNDQAVTSVHAYEPNRLDNLTAVRSIWPTQSTNPPAWVECEDERLAEDLADVFSDENHTCSIGKPKGWGE
jgi:hypothetical protein